MLMSLALCLSLIGCEPNDSQVTRSQARNSLCVPVSGIGSVGSTDPGDIDVEPFTDALEIDKQLLADAGDRSTADAVAEALDGFRESASETLPVSVYLDDDATQEEIPSTKQAITAKRRGSQQTCRVATGSRREDAMMREWG